jgi:iron complex outermembrane recepter protein
VLTPVQGLTASLDWYYIRINHVINEGLSPPAIALLCEQGNASFCNDFVYGTYPGGCVGLSCPLSLPLRAVISQAVNSDWETTSGFDFLADYHLPFGPGTLDFNTDMNYVSALDYSSLGTTCDPENGLGIDQFDFGGCVPEGDPKFRGTVAVSYAQGGWLGTVQARMIGAAHLVTQWINTPEVDNNNIPFYTYIDLRLSYKFDNGIQLYGAIDNFFDRVQPVVPFSPFSFGTLYEPPYRDDIYDGFGRVWRVGLRAKF